MSKRKSSQKAQEKSNNPTRRLSPPVIVAIIATIGTIIAAIIAWNSTILAVILPIEATQTAEAIHTSVALETQTYSMNVPGVVPSTPTSTLIPAFTDTPTNVPPTITSTPPSPLAEVFPQIEEGQEYTFGDDVFSRDFLTTADCAHTGVYGLQLNYKMQKDDDFGGWGVQWITSPAEYLDISAFDSIVFWVKGSSGGETFQMVIADTDKADQSIKIHEISPITTEWTQITIPLSQINSINTASIQAMEFAFYGRDGSGSICIDDIALLP